jgi:1-acyl-sn-glycerol-3-phosphate acyltransferase
MAKKELFDKPIVGWFVRSGGGFPIDRARPSAATIKQVISLVQAGKLVLIFPHGTRAQAEAKRGAATIALHAKGLVVPAFYEGPTQIRLIHLFRRPAIRICFGAPIEIPPNAPSDKDAAMRLTDEIDRAMSALRLTS